jgi:hypothetical protein
VSIRAIPVASSSCIVRDPPITIGGHAIALGSNRCFRKSAFRGSMKEGFTIIRVFFESLRLTGVEIGNPKGPLQIPCWPRVVGQPKEAIARAANACKGYELV